MAGIAVAIGIPSQKRADHACIAFMCIYNTEISIFVMQNMSKIVVLIVYMNMDIRHGHGHGIFISATSNEEE